MPRDRKKIIDVASAIVLLALVMLDAIVWQNMFGAFDYAAASGDTTNNALRTYSLPVTHASSTLLILPGGETILIDAGSDDAIVDALQKVLPSGAPAYIDLAIISTPDAADYEGYQYLLQHYGIGAFLYNGRADDDHSTEWQQFMGVITTKHIPLITVGAGDSINYRIAAAPDGAQKEIDITAPDAAHAHSPNASDTTIFLLYNK